MTWNLDPGQRRVAAGTDVAAGRVRRLPAAPRRGRSPRACAPATSSRAPTACCTVGPFKVITDGSLNTRTAYCFDEYPASRAADAHGLLTVPPEELVGAARRGRDAGLVPAVHAIGDHANASRSTPSRRSAAAARIEHAQLLAEADIARFAGLGVVASVQPEHAMDDRDVADRYWAGRTGRAFALREPARRRARRSRSARTPRSRRSTRGSRWRPRSGAPATGASRGTPSSAIPAAEALAASTGARRGRARAARPTSRCWSTTRSPPAPTLRTMPVAATLLAGRLTHRAL